MMIRRFADLGYLPQGFANSPGSDQDATEAQTDARTRLVRDESRFNLALVHLHHGRPYQAVEILESLVEQRTASQVRYLRTLAHASLMAGSFEKTLVYAGELESRGETGVEIELIASHASLRCGKIEEGERRLARAMAMAPDCAGVHRFAGERRAEQGLWQEAIAHFRSALRLDPEDSTSQIGLSRALSHTKRFEESLESALDVVSRFHFHPEGHFLLGKAWLGLGDTDRAIASLQLTLQQAPGHSGARAMLMELYRSYGSWGKGLSLRESMEERG